MNSIRRNTIANYFGRAGGIVLVYLFIPLYIKFLGIESYGLVGFYSTLLGVLAFVDMGLTATLSREMARLSVLKDTAGTMRDLLRTYEFFYLIISLTVACVIWVIAPVISERWLQAGSIPPDKIAKAIRLMGMAIALQLPSGLYNGGLLGLQKQVLYNSLQMAWGVLRGVGGVLVLWLISPTIVAFAFWQLFSNAVYYLAARFCLWRGLPAAVSKPRFNRILIRETWHYAAGMAGITICSTLLVQTDKLAVSKMLPLEMFGYYTLASALASVPLMLANPLGVAVFPRLTGLVSLGEKDNLRKFYHRVCGLVSVAVLPGALTLTAFMGKFIFAWTGSAAAAQKAGPVASFLLCGSIIQAILIIPYYLALAHGNIRLNLILGIVSVVLIIPLLILLIMKYGLIGGGVSWLILNLCTLPIYTFLVHRRFLPGELRTWVLRDLGRPLIVALPIIVLSRWLFFTPSSRLVTFGLIGLVWSVSTAAAALAIPDLRKEIILFMRKLFHISYGVPS
jgi:O-antigen/teichoic acid export membrane protein